MSTASSWDTIGRYVVISADTHGGAPIGDYRQYVPSRLHDEFDAWAAGYESPYDDLVGDTGTKNWDNDLRISQLEADGISAEVLIPNTIPPFFPTIQNIIPLPRPGRDYELRMEGLRAHNRWAADFCTLLPGRRRALFQVFPNDIDDAMAEVQWAKDTGVAAGILMSAAPPNHEVEALYASRYDRLWALCAELELPVAQHEGTGVPHYPDHPASAGISSFEQSYFAQRTLWHLILGGVFERHPNLRYCFVEQGVNWIPDALQRIDDMIELARKRPWTGMYFKGAIDPLTMTAWEYFSRNCYVAHPLRPIEIEDCYRLGIDRVMWGSDYPHTDATTPHSKLALQLSLGSVDDADCRKVLAGTASSVFGFDLDALVPAAERIGPDVTEIHRQIDNSDLPDTEWFELRANKRITMAG